VNAGNGWESVSGTTHTFSGLNAGTYTVDIRDASQTSCVVTLGTQVITRPAALSALGLTKRSYNGSDLSAFGATDGEVTVTVTGGTSPYQYKANGGVSNDTYQTSNKLTGFGAGSYTVTVKDANNCTQTGEVVFVAPGNLGLASSVTTNYNGFGTKCNTSSDGTVEVTTTGGTAPYRYQKNSEGYGATTNSLTATFGSLSAGTYTFYVKDVNDNVANIQQVVTSPTVVTASAAGRTSVHPGGTMISCYGQSDGAAIVTPGGGAGTYSYKASAGTYQSYQTATSILTGLHAGTHTIYVKDGNDCEVSTTVVITQPTQLAFAANKPSIRTDIHPGGTMISCFGQSDGRIETAVTGGTGAMTYSLAGSKTETGNTNGTFTGLWAGTYTVSVTDVNSCSITSSSIVISQPAQLAFTVGKPSISTPHAGGTMISCYGQSDGEITASVQNGTGTGSVTYSLAGSRTVTGNTNGTFTGLWAGTYTVTATDANGCAITSTSLVITQPAVFEFASGKPSIRTDVHAGGTMISCAGQSDGQIVAAVQGGTGSATYSLAGSRTVTGNTNGTFTGLWAGTYTVTATDVNGCSATSSSLVITQPTSISVSVVNTTGAVHVADNADVTLTATISGGTQSDGSPTYTYTWTKPTGSESVDYVSESGSGTKTVTFRITDAELVSNGTYSLTVTDRNGCSSTSSAIRVIVYDNTLYVDDIGSDVSGDGSSTNPLASIQKAIDVAKSGNTLEVQGGTYIESPSIDKNLTINCVSDGSAVLSSGKFFIYNAASVTWDSDWPTSVFSSVGVKTGGSISTALGKVTAGASAKLYIIGNHVITSGVTVNKEVTISGINSDGTTSGDALNYTGCDINPPASVTLSSTSGSELTAFKFTGSATKSVTDLAIKIRNTGFFFEISNGSSGAVNPVTNCTFEWDHDGDGTLDVSGGYTAYRRLFGIQNGSYSNGDKWDVAKFVNDASESSSGYGSGYVTYGNNGPLPAESVSNAWQATDGSVNTDNQDVSTLYSMKGGVDIAGGAFSNRKPNYFTPNSSYFNSKGYLKFNGATEYLEANSNSDIVGGTGKTLFVAFNSVKTGADQVIYKHGNHVNGMSLVHLSDGRISVNIYNGETDATRESWVFESGSSHSATGFDGKHLIVQLYFNGTGGTNTNSRRVGAALFDSSGRNTFDIVHTGATQSDGYVDNVAFSSNSLTTPTIGAASVVSWGARSGAIYYKTQAGSQSITTTTSRSLFSGARIAEVLLLNTADEAKRDATYCYLRNKYFSTGNGTGNTLDKQGEDDVIAGEAMVEPDLVVFPNPVESFVNVEALINVGGYITVTLRDALGRDVSTLFQGDVTDRSMLTISGDVRLVPTGTYFIHVSGPAELNLTTPIIVRH
jgi:hypothetical protein